MEAAESFLSVGYKWVTKTGSLKPVLARVDPVSAPSKHASRITHHGPLPRGPGSKFISQIGVTTGRTAGIKGPVGQIRAWAELSKSSRCSMSPETMPPINWRCGSSAKPSRFAVL